MFNENLEIALHAIAREIPMSYGGDLFDILGHSLNDEDEGDDMIDPYDEQMEFDTVPAIIRTCLEAGF